MCTVGRLIVAKVKRRILCYSGAVSEWVCKSISKRNFGVSWVVCIIACHDVHGDSRDGQTADTSIFRKCIDVGDNIYFREFVFSLVILRWLNLVVIAYIPDHKTLAHVGCMFHMQFSYKPVAIRSKIEFPGMYALSGTYSSLGLKITLPSHWIVGSGMIMLQKRPVGLIASSGKYCIAVRKRI